MQFKICLRVNIMRNIVQVALSKPNRYIMITGICNNVLFTELEITASIYNNIYNIYIYILWLNVQ